jgi:hypothetical protein
MGLHVSWPWHHTFTPLLAYLVEIGDAEGSIALLLLVGRRRVRRRGRCLLLLNRRDGEGVANLGHAEYHAEPDVATAPNHGAKSTLESP